MKIIIAPDSFKGSVTAAGVADAIEQGVLDVFPDAQTVKLPVADGGEGLLEAMYSVTGGTWTAIEACGPLGEPVQAKFLLTDETTAVIEMAQASGLPLVPRGKKDPMKATTYGTGQLITAALDKGVKKIIIGLGGSATNDGGAGMAQALGARLLDEAGQELPVGGGALDQLSRVDLSQFDARIKAVEIVAACDISNPLCGESGASAVYGPQKGATPELVEKLDYNLGVFADCLAKTIGKDYRNEAGAGAAGGIGFGLMALCGARLCLGIEIVLDMVELDRHLQGAQLCITGEGRVDFQSAFGKVPDGIAQRAKKAGVPVMVIAGSVGDGAEKLYERGVWCMSGIQHKPMGLDECLRDAPELLRQTAGRLMRAVSIGMEMK